MNNKLTAGLILLLIVSQGFINYRLNETNKLIAAYVYLSSHPNQLETLIDGYLQENRKKRGNGSVSDIQAGNYLFGKAPATT